MTPSRKLDPSAATVRGHACAVEGCTYYASDFDDIKMHIERAHACLTSSFTSIGVDGSVCGLEAAYCCSECHDLFVMPFIDCVAAVR